MRNIVLITLDSLRSDHCSFLGYRRETTPIIDKLARNSLYFENAIAPSSGTPESMTALFSGEHSALDQGLIDPQERRKELLKRKLLPEILSEKGYASGAIVPNAFVSSYFGFNKGFSYFQDFLSEGSEKGLMDGLHQKIFEGFAQNKKWAPPLRNAYNLIRKKEVFRPWEDYYENILGWVDKVNKPFFLWVLLIDTHFPYLAPKKFRKWGNLLDMYLYNWKVQAAKWYPDFTEKERQKLINAYDDSILYADAFVKRLWRDLRCEDPIFMIHADHGDGFGEHGFYMHNPPLLYEELIHVPLIIYNSDNRGKIENPISLINLLPMTLDLAKGKNSSVSTNLFNKEWVISKVFENRKRRLAIRMKNWKFITGQKDKDELYDLRIDPSEQESIIEKHPKLVDEMKKITSNHIACERSRIKNNLL